MKLTKEEVELKAIEDKVFSELEEIREIVSLYKPGVRSCLPYEDAIILLSHIDHLEERVKELELDKQAVQVQLDVINSCKKEIEDGNGPCGVCRDCARIQAKNLQSQLNQLREACKIIAIKYEPHRKHIEKIKDIGIPPIDDLVITLDFRNGDLRRIAELVKGGMGFENI